MFEDGGGGVQPLLYPFVIVGHLDCGRVERRGSDGEAQDLGHSNVQFEIPCVFHDTSQFVTYVGPLETDDSNLDPEGIETDESGGFPLFADDKNGWSFDPKAWD